MNDFQVQRHNMVESQVRTCDVTDRRITAAMADIPREDFVPAALRPVAYMDRELVVRASQGKLPERAMLAPMVLARMIQLADVKSTDLILDVGCGTGYSTAVLARLAESVVGLEGDEALSERASSMLSEHSADNAAIMSGSLANGCPDHGPYDVIILQGRVSRVADSWRAQLKDGGRLVAIVGEQPMAKVVCFIRHGDGWSGVAAFDASAPKLPGFPQEETFVF
jgi:protein-L-isoaspartate(D-aspartate) O-methyltransferase